MNNWIIVWTVAIFAVTASMLIKIIFTNDSWTENGQIKTAPMLFFYAWIAFLFILQILYLRYGK